MKIYHDLKLLTINEHHWLFNRVLVVKLRINKSSADEGAKQGALIPSNMKMVNVHMPQIPHHFHLVLNCKIDQKSNYYKKQESAFSIWIKMDVKLILITNLSKMSGKLYDVITNVQLMNSIKKCLRISQFYMYQ